MEIIRIGAKTVEYDAERTRRIYSLAPRGSSWGCRCAGCRNFEKVAPAGFTPQLKSLLHDLGVDPRKETFSRHLVPVSPGFSLYSGTYAFCGAIREGHAEQKFRSDVFEPCGDNSWITARPFADAPGVWYGKPCLRLEFLLVLPWRVEDEQLPLIELGCSPA